MKLPGVDEGLLRRWRAAGEEISWRPAPALRGKPRSPAARIARLHHEEARVEIVDVGTTTTVEVGSGPVGALVLLLEADRRGTPTALGSRNAGTTPGFPDGSIVASWGSRPFSVDARPTLQDLVELARFALD